jgi:DUF3040 family protein
VPLSDHEQRILAELEESLVKADPEFAERVRSETVYRHAGRYCKWAAVTFILGVVILVAFYSKSVVAGFLGVIIMFASAVWFERNLRRMGRAGWHDLTRSKDGEPRTSGASSGIEGAVSGARDWFRTRFHRREG